MAEGTVSLNPGPALAVEPEPTTYSTNHRASAGPGAVRGSGEVPAPDAGSGPWAVAHEGLILTILLLPAGLAIEWLGPNGLGVTTAVAWLFPAAQLAYSRNWVRRFERFSRESLAPARGDAGSPGLLYDERTIDAAWARYFRRVLGMAPILRGGRATGLIGGSVPNQFPIERPGAEAVPPGGARIGTAETLFLTPLVYLHLLVMEFDRRTAGSPDGDPAADTPRMLALDAYLRRVGEWFRRRLDARSGRFRAAIFAEATLYFTYRVERLRAILAGPEDGRVGRFEDELEQLGASDPESVTEERLDREVEGFAREYQVGAVDPYLIELASFAPRLVLTLVLGMFLFARDGPSPVGLLARSVSAGGPVAAASLAGLAAGLVALAISASAYSPDRFLTPIGRLPRRLRWARGGAGRLLLSVGLAAGTCGSLALVPGLAQGRPDLAGLVLPSLGAALAAVESLTLWIDGVSFLGVLRAYHFRPTAVLGSPRLIAFHFVHYALSLALGAWIGVTVAPYLEGHLLAVWQAPASGAGGYPWAAHGWWTVGLAGAVALCIVATSPGWASWAAGLFVVVAAPTLMTYRPLGGFVIGAAALVASLYLGNYALFNLAIGLSAVARELGRPARLVGLALATATLGPLAWALGPLRHGEWPAAASGLLLLDLAAVASGLALLVGLAEPCIAGLIIPAAVGGFIAPDWWGTTPSRRALVALMAFGVGLRLARTVADRRSRRPPGVPAAPPPDGALAILWTATNPIASPALTMGRERAVERHRELWGRVVEPCSFASAGALRTADGRPVDSELALRALEFLFDQELRRRRSLFGAEAIAVRGRPRSLVQERLAAAVNEAGDALNLLCEVDRPDEAELLHLGLRVQRYLATRIPLDDPVGRMPASQRDTMAYAVDLAHALKAAGLERTAILYLQSNEYGPPMPPDPAEATTLLPTSRLGVDLDERLALAEYLGIVAGLETQVVHVHSFDACKSAAQNGLTAAFARVRAAYILDRNSQSFTLSETVADIRRILTESGLAVVLPARTTPNVAFPVGSQADLGEAGHSVAIEAMVRDLGADRGEMLATGWGNLVALPLNRLIRQFADPRVPCRFDPGSRDLARWFGSFHGLLNLPHVSEDYVQAIGSAEGLKGLGLAPGLGVGSGQHYKLREHSTTLEFLAARPRWAGGGDPGQKGRDPLFQRLREFGTDSIFMREMQRDRGRYYLTAPVAMIAILMTPVMVVTGYSPFVGISVLFLMGLGSNQALTLSGLAAWLRRAGLAGGGARWLAQRFRDALLFPSVAFIEMCGVLDAIRRGPCYPYVFQTSGHARMDDYATGLARSAVSDGRAYRLMSAMVLTGLAGTAINVAAIARLDLVNLLMLYPTLLFTLGLLLGAHVYQHQRGPGRSPLGLRRWAPKLAGAALGAAAVALLSLGLGAGRQSAAPRPLAALGVPAHAPLLALGGAIIFGVLPLRTLLAPLTPPEGDGKKKRAARSARARERWHNGLVLAGWLGALGLLGSTAAGEPGSLGGKLRLGAAVCAVGLARLLALLVIWALRGWPGVPRPADRGYARETAARSALIAVAALMWFALVPVPAVFSVQVLTYEATLSPRLLRLFLTTLAEGIGLIVLVGWLSLALRWKALDRRFRRAHRAYHDLVGLGRLGPAESSAAEAALEGYRVARDTDATDLAARRLEFLDRALRAAADATA